MASGGSAPDVPGIYMVDASFPDKAHLADWLEWYRRHIDMLLREVSLFVAAQRFRTLDPARPDFLGIYALTSGRMFTSTEYLSRGGQYPSEWLDLVRDWHRGFYTGIDMVPEVRSDEVLLLTDQPAEAVKDLALDFLWMKAAGLKPRAPQRGLAIVNQARARDLASHPALTAFAPLTPRQLKPQAA